MEFDFLGYKIGGAKYMKEAKRLKSFEQKGCCKLCGLFIDHFYDGNYSLEVMIEYQGEERLIHLDHIKPKALGGSDELENLQVLCRECNLTKRALIIGDN